MKYKIIEKYFGRDIGRIINLYTCNWNRLKIFYIKKYKYGNIVKRTYYHIMSYNKDCDRDTQNISLCKISKFK